MCVRTKLQAIFQDVFMDDALQLRDDMVAADVEDWDSFAQIQLIVRSEATFDIKFTIPEIQGLADVGSFIALIERKRAQPAVEGI